MKDEDRKKRQKEAQKQETYNQDTAPDTHCRFRRKNAIALAVIAAAIPCGTAWKQKPSDTLSGSQSSQASVSMDSISAGGYHTVAVNQDGTVRATSLPDDFEDNDGQCNVDDWTDIIKVSAGWNHTVGLKADGTVLATGYNGFDECEVSSWTGIIDISGGAFYTIGLKEDGTAVATGFNGYGQCDVSSWTDITAISAGSGHTVGLKSDGTVVAVGTNESGQCEAAS